MKNPAVPVDSSAQNGTDKNRKVSYYRNLSYILNAVDLPVMILNTDFTVSFINDNLKERLHLSVNVETDNLRINTDAATTDALKGLLVHEGSFNNLLRLEIQNREINLGYDWDCLSLTFPGSSEMKILCISDYRSTGTIRDQLFSENDPVNFIVENIGVGVALIDTDMRILALNGKMKEWFPGVDTLEKPICFKSFNNPPGVDVCEYCPMKHTFNDGQIHESVTTTPTPEGIRNYRIVASPVKNSRGEIVAGIEMVEDMTEKIQYEEALKKSEWRFRVMAETIQDVFWMSRMKEGGNYLDEIIYVSPVFEKLTGIKLRDYNEVKELYFKLIHPDDLPPVIEAHKACFYQHTEYSCEYRIVLPNEQTLWISERGFPVEAGGDLGQIVVGICHDITERKQFENEINRLMNIYTTMINAVPAMMYIKDSQLRYVSANKVFCSTINKEEKDIIGKTVFEVFESGVAELEDKTDKIVLSENKRFVEQDRRLKVNENDEIWVSITKVPIHDAAGNISGIVGLIQNVTEHHQSRDKLVQADKLAAIGTLAAGVAHEINNPIGFINSNLNTMSKYLGKVQKVISEHVSKEVIEESSMDDILEDFNDAINESIEGSTRVKEIVADLKSFSRVDKAEMEYANLNEGIKSTLNIVWNELKYHCTVDKELGDIPDIFCRPNQINQVFMNILINAGHAITHNEGKILIKSWHEGEKIYVSITDNGKGIPDDALDKIFQPFYTTKEVGKGTGLGLSLAYDIIKKHHGTIEVNSKVGKGTTFTIILPTKGLENER